jgi:hypothetical protein
MVLKESREFRFDIAVAKRYSARHDKRRIIARCPKHMDDFRHQPKDASGSLKAFERRPVLVKARKQFRVDGIGTPDALLIGWIAALARKVAAVLPIVLDVLVGDGIPQCQRFGSERLEQAAPNYRETFIW